jgi:hypothetical protein
MAYAACASIACARAPRLPQLTTWRRRGRNPCATHHSSLFITKSRHFLTGRAAIKNARKSPENNALHFSNRLKTAICSARFSQVLRSKNRESPVTHGASRFTNHQSLLTNHAFLIASRQILKIELAHSQQMRKHFLIATFSRISAPHLTNHHSPVATFLFNTNKAHRIIILVRALMKTKEKQFSIQYKFALRDICLPMPLAPQHVSISAQAKATLTKLLMLRYGIDTGLRGLMKGGGLYSSF